MAFELPIPGLFVDLDAASGSICLTDEFLNAPAAVRVEVLQQWMDDLAQQQESALVQLFRTFSRDHKSLSIVEQIERFRLHCDTKGITCPSDFAILLQRY